MEALASQLYGWIWLDLWLDTGYKRSLIYSWIWLELWLTP